MGVSKNRGFSPQIIHFNRVFHYFHHPFWGKHPYFPNHLDIFLLRSCRGPSRALKRKGSPSNHQFAKGFCCEFQGGYDYFGLENVWTFKKDLAQKEFVWSCLVKIFVSNLASWERKGWLIHVFFSISNHEIPSRFRKDLVEKQFTNLRIWGWGHRGIYRWWSSWCFFIFGRCINGVNLTSICYLFATKSP